MDRKQQAINEVYRQLKAQNVKDYEYGRWSIRFWLLNPETGRETQTFSNAARFDDCINRPSFLTYDFLHRATAVAIYPRQSKKVPEPVRLAG